MSQKYKLNFFYQNEVTVSCLCRAEMLPYSQKKLLLYVGFYLVNQKQTVEEVNLLFLENQKHRPTG